MKKPNKKQIEKVAAREQVPTAPTLPPIGEQVPLTDEHKTKCQELRSKQFSIKISLANKTLRFEQDKEEHRVAIINNERDFQSLSSDILAVHGIDPNKDPAVHGSWKLDVENGAMIRIG